MDQKWFANLLEAQNKVTEGESNYAVHFSDNKYDQPLDHHTNI